MPRTYGVRCCQLGVAPGPRAGREKDDDLYPPRFNVPLWDRRIPINDPLAIECHVDAKPVAEIEWFKDGKELSSPNASTVRL